MGTAEALQVRVQVEVGRRKGFVGSIKTLGRHKLYIDNPDVNGEESSFNWEFANESWYKEGFL